MICFQAHLQYDVPGHGGVLGVQAYQLLLDHPNVGSLELRLVGEDAGTWALEEGCEEGTAWAAAAAASAVHCSWRTGTCAGWGPSRLAALR